jgi:bacteriorhodopsin
MAAVASATVQASKPASGLSGEYMGALDLPKGTGYGHSSGKYLLDHDGVGVSFWLATGIMLASTLFFFLESRSVPKQWSASVTVAGLVTGVAFYNYCYMREIWVETQQSPQIYRYTDWLITVPLQIVEFYLILNAVKPVSSGLLYRLQTASIVMLVAGYLGDTGIGECWMMFIIGMAGWFWIIYEVFNGEAAALSVEAGKTAPSAQKAFNSMRMILTWGWSMYPIGYIVGHTGPSADSGSPAILNIVYNVADLVNKTAFGLCVYSAARSDMKR